MIDQNTKDIPVLIGFEGDVDNQRWMLHHALVFGRDSDCDIAIPNRQVSRHHAQVTPTAEGIILEDLGSKNGTHRNGKPINGPVQLADGDIIHIALAQKFIFMSADATLPLDIEGSSYVLQLDEKRLRLEKRSRRVWVAEKEVIPPLSVSQFRLLEILYINSGQLVPRDIVMATVWGKDNAIGISEQALDALVRRLRDRLLSVDPSHAYIITIRGHGFRLDNPIIDNNP
jgi:DNA-binding winged helix-turn-helix (wHTH) protein